MDSIVKDWFVSSHTGANNSCVEARVYSNGFVDIRNSNDREAGMVSFTRQEWLAFIAGAKDGEFDIA